MMREEVNDKKKKNIKNIEDNKRVITMDSLKELLRNTKFYYQKQNLEYIWLENWRGN